MGLILDIANRGEIARVARKAFVKSITDSSKDAEEIEKDVNKIVDMAINMKDDFHISYRNRLKTEGLL